MKRISLLPILILISTILIAQERVDLDIIYKIKQEGLQNSQVMETAFYLTDVSGSRLTGSDGLKRASDWAVNQLSEWGLQNANLEKWGEFGKGWDIEKSYVAMTAPYYQPLIASPKAWTPGTTGEITGEVFAQIGNRTREPANLPFARFIEYDEMVRRIKEADIVVTHGGSTVMLCLLMGKIPIVVPRDPILGEHIDDHQIRLVRVIASTGKFLVVSRESEIIPTVRHYHELVKKMDARGLIFETGRAKLVSYLHTLAKGHVRKITQG